MKKIVCLFQYCYEYKCIVFFDCRIRNRATRSIITTSSEADLDLVELEIEPLA